MSSASRCVVLVPVGGAIDSGCEDGLRELERRGYAVWRVRGYSAIDAARNQMAGDTRGTTDYSMSARFSHVSIRTLRGPLRR